MTTPTPSHRTAGFPRDRSIDILCPFARETLFVSDRFLMTWRAPDYGRDDTRRRRRPEHSSVGREAGALTRKVAVRASASGWLPCPQALTSRAPRTRSAGRGG